MTMKLPSSTASTYTNADVLVNNPTIKEAQFLSLQSGVTVYSLASVQPPTGPAQLLLSSATKLHHVTSFGGDLGCVELDLPCLPATGRVLGVAAYLDQEAHQLHYAFTVVNRKDDDSPAVYSVHCHQYGAPCEVITLHCQPYHLLHTTVPSNGGKCHKDVYIITGAQTVVIGKGDKLKPNTQPPESRTNDCPSSSTNAASTSLHHSKATMQEDSGTATDDFSKICKKLFEDDKKREISSVPVTKSVVNASKTVPSAAVAESLLSPSAEAGELGDGGTSEPTTRKFEVMDTAAHFPELLDLKCRVIKVSMVRTPDMTRRITAVCGEDGNVLVRDVRLKGPTQVYTPEVVFRKHFKFEHTMSSCILFREIEPKLLYPDSLPNIMGITNPETYLLTPKYHLLATSCINGATFFQGVLGKRNPPAVQLPVSGDSVLCSLTCHLTGDERSYIVLGTYCQTILIYMKLYPPSHPGGVWTLRHTLSTGAPVMALDFADLTGDGVKVLVALTAAGLQCFAVDPHVTARALRHRLLLVAPKAPLVETESSAVRSLRF